VVTALPLASLLTTFDEVSAKVVVHVEVSSACFTHTFCSAPSVTVVVVTPVAVSVCVAVCFPFASVWLQLVTVPCVVHTFVVLSASYVVVTIVFVGGGEGCVFVSTTSPLAIVFVQVVTPLALEQLLDTGVVELVELVVVWQTAVPVVKSQ
jgi:hypothetical protein